MEEQKLPIERELEEALAMAEAEPEVSPRCAEVLARPLDKETCLSFREVRRRNMCRAWELMSKERASFRDAIKRAWAETQEECREVGIYSEEEPEVDKAVELLDPGGKRAGTISLMKDGRVEFCHREIGCDVTHKASPEAYYLAQAFFSGAYGYGIRPLEG